MEFRVKEWIQKTTKDSKGYGWFVYRDQLFIGFVSELTAGLQTLRPSAVRLTGSRFRGLGPIFVARAC